MGGIGGKHRLIASLSVTIIAVRPAIHQHIQRQRRGDIGQPGIIQPGVNTGQVFGAV